jgi:hypothetical protein
MRYPAAMDCDFHGPFRVPWPGPKPAEYPRTPRSKKLPPRQLNRGALSAPGRARSAPWVEVPAVGFFCATAAADIPQLWAAREPEAESGPPSLATPIPHMKWPS